MTNKEIVKKVVDAFLATDLETVLSHMTEDVQMGWPGFFDLKPGKQAIREFFKDIPEMISSGIEDIIEEGNKVAATGAISSKFANGEIKNSFFCDIYTLEAGLVKSIKSYMVFEEKKE